MLVVIASIRSMNFREVLASRSGVSGASGVVSVSTP